ALVHASATATAPSAHASGRAPISTRLSRRTGDAGDGDGERRRGLVAVADLAVVVPSRAKDRSVRLARAHVRLLGLDLDDAGAEPGHLRRQRVRSGRPGEAADAEAAVAPARRR